ncbi:glycosyltransferase family 4 protein [uncultured Arcticibacterium sp.]|uniref:glycosyltransferase family 4 protein n=1 Tax=uncultured Arcticibacterium sp. TaxID=2173042 RepID=UPI0030FBAD01
MNKKRIAIISSGSVGTGFNSEGIPHHAVLIDKLAANYDITIFSFARVNENFTPKKYKVIDVSFLANQRLLFRFLYLFFQLSCNHLKNPYQIFLGFWGFPSGFLAVLVGKIYRRPSIAAFIGGEVVHLPKINYGEFHKKWFRKLLRFTASNTDTLLVLSKYQKKKIKESGLFFKQIQLIPFGVDSRKFKFTNEPLKRPLQLLHVADINLVKDQETLLRTFKKIRENVDAHLTIIGRDTLEGKMQALAQKLGLDENISFLGRISYEKLPAYFAKSHIFLLTSLSESQAVVVNEAMASGLVVAGTRVGLIADLENLCTLAVDIKDSDSLAQKVIALINNPQQLEDYKAKGLDWTIKHDINWTVRSYQEIFESLSK